jgi:hypothetical protein
MAVISVRGEEIIICAQTRQGRYAGGFLADVQMIMTAKNTTIMQRHQILFEVTDDEHPTTQIQ